MLNRPFNPSGGVYPLYPPVDGSIILAYMKPKQSFSSHVLGSHFKNPNICHLKTVYLFSIFYF